jgi:maltose alpha-D-glucosyltransferase/alpha-amylase
VITPIALHLPGFLSTQRWYGDKSSAIASVAIVDFGQSGDVQHVIADVRSVSGSVSRYYVPLLVNESGEISDAAHDVSFHRWIVANDRNPEMVRMTDGKLTWRPTRRAGGDTVAIEGPSRVLAVEQSNTSIRFGDAALVKVLRRLQPGINPEIELTQYLTERTTFKNSPALLGVLTYGPDEGEPTTLAVAQSFVPSVSDGWTAVLADLGNLSAKQSDERSIMVAHSHLLVDRLGRRTAELHLALSSDPWTRALAPESISEADVNEWKRGFAASLKRVSGSLARHAASNEQTSDLERAFTHSNARLLDRISGFDRLNGVAKTRVHGDYHLGQTLLTRGDDWFILDFEGEPMRRLDERRAKTSPLKDVAGMLRSFSYARGSAERAGGDVAELVEWERGARASFLGGYLTTARAGKAGFLPQADEDIRLALDAWELDKAIYEIDYELNNRPEWLWLPLSAALKFA